MKNYWKMSTAELEKEAARYHIAEYYEEARGLLTVSRKAIIDQLLAIENARNMSVSRLAMLVSLLATVMNVGLTIVNFLSR